MHENILIDRIIGLRMFRLTEFGTRVSFKIESAEQRCVTCCAAGDVAQEFIAHYCEGDVVVLSGIYGPRPSTASSNTSWAGRFRVRALRGLGSVCAQEHSTAASVQPRFAKGRPSSAIPELITALVLSALVCIPIGASAQGPEVSTPMMSDGLRDVDPVQKPAIGTPWHLSTTRTSFDVTNLPPIESIGADSDIRPFLQPGIPQELTRAALRRAWVTDPAIRNFIGLSANSRDDLNSPSGASRLGSLTALTDEVQAGSSAQVK